MNLVHTLSGTSATAWLMHEDPNLVNREDLRTHEFDTKAEADAFRSGVQLAIDAALHCDCSPPLILLDENEYIVAH